MYEYNIILYFLYLFTGRRRLKRKTTRGIASYLFHTIKTNIVKIIKI